MRGKEQFIHEQSKQEHPTGDKCGRGWKNWKWYQWFRLTGITVAVYVTMEYVLPVVFPFCVGLVLALALNPLCRFLERRMHLKRELAATLSMALFAVFLLALLAGLGWLVLQAGNYVAGSGLRELLLLRSRSMWRLCCDRVHALTGSWLLQPESYERVVGRFTTGKILPDADRLGPALLRMLAGVLVTAVGALLMLMELDQVKEWLSHLSRRLFHRGFGSSLGRVAWTWARAQLLILGAVTSICALGLLAARVHGWLLIGIGIGICDALPFLGTGICFLPWALWRLLNGRYLTFAWFVVLYMLTSMTRQLLEPRLIGKRIGVPPLLVLISVYVGVKVYSRGGFLLGPVSAFLIWQLASDRVEMEDAYESDKRGNPKDDPI